MTQQKGQTHGTRNLKEASTFMVRLLMAAEEAGRDGIQINEDGQAVIQDPRVQAALLPMVEQADLVTAEIKDLNFFEGIDFAIHILRAVKEEAEHRPRWGEDEEEVA